MILSRTRLWVALAARALVGLPAHGQTAPDAAGAAAIRKAFDDTSAPRLRCQASPIHPALNFSLRFQAGYRIDVPLSQFRGSGHSLTVDLRVTPEGRDAIYLAKTEQLPAVPETKADAEPSGAFAVGEGAYRVDVLVRDDLQRVCRSGWKIQAQLSPAERQLTARIASGAVEELSAASPPEAKHGLRIGRLTVLLHAAPSQPNRSGLQPAEVTRLADSLSSLLVELPANSVRLVAFNLDQRAVLFRKDEFTAGDMGEVSEEITKLQLATVDYRVLKRTEKPIDLLAGLVQAELAGPNLPDALIVMGPPTQSYEGAAPGAQNPRPPALPIFYLQYQSNAQRAIPQGPLAGPGRGGAGRPGRFPGPLDGTVPVAPGTGFPDSIARLIASLKGETIPVWNPHDFAAAIRRMDSRMVKNALPPIVTAKAAAPSPVEAPPEGSAGAPAVSNAGHRAADPTGNENPIEVLARVRDQVLPHAERIPNYTCVETLRRDRYEPADGRTTLACGVLLDRRKQPNFAGRLKLDRTDWLRLDVAMTTTREIYSWAGASKFEEGEIDELVPEGAFGTGPFASLLLSAFQSRDRTYVFEGETQENRRRLFEYSFAVPKERSYYRVKAGKEWVVTGYSGNLLVDPKTAELVRLVVRTEELPAETFSCETDTSLEYGLVQLGEGDYLLPKMTHQRFIGRDGTEDDNAVTFSACREYQAESQLSFGESGAVREGQPKLPAGGLDLPAGLPVTVELTTAIRPGESAAGDRLQGRLAQPIVDAQKKMLVPAGVEVEGRIMRLETSYTPHLETTVVLRWETIRVGGAALPLWLLPNRRPPEPTAVTRGQLRQRGMPIELPLPSESRYAIFHLAGEHAGIESGSRSEWFTASR